MAEANVVKPVAAPVPFMRYTRDQVARQKQSRDERRKAIRGQNANSKVMK